MPDGAGTAQDNVATGNDINLDKIPSSAPVLEKSIDMAAPVPALKPGQSVVHKFDVVVANLFESPADFPPGPPAETLARDRIDSILSDSAKWWSDNTKLAFDFNQDTKYKTINTTCNTIEQDAFAAMGQPYDQTVYTTSGRDLLIFQMDHSCDLYNGIAMSMPDRGDVFAGGIFQVVIQPWNSHEFTVFDTAHEFGHTIGLLHSNILDCRNSGWSGDDQVGPLWDGTFTETGCVSQNYLDLTTIMGNQFAFAPAPVTLNSLQKQYLGVDWGDAAVVGSPTNAQTFTISRYDLDSASPHGVIVSTPDKSYALEFRPLDTDNYWDLSGVLNRTGIYLTAAYRIPRFGQGTDIVSPVGLTNNPWNAITRPVPLGTGETYVSGDGVVRLRTLSVNDTTAQVEVTVTDKKGVPGDVSIKKDGATLKAQTRGDSRVPANIAYQWFRNGQAIAGATGANYTPTLPDPNAVFRVQATFSATDRATTTRDSRGIIADDRRLVVDNGHVSINLLDQNGGRLDCTNMPLTLGFTAPDGQDLGRRWFLGQPTAQLGVCTGQWSLPLTGEFTVSAFNPVNEKAYMYWRNMYWPAATASTTISATAGVMIGLLPPPVIHPYFDSGNNFNDINTPRLFSGLGEPPMAVTVSVTDDTGAPAVGVPVTLSSSEKTGVVFTPSTPVTDRYGLAHAIVAEDRSLPPPPEGVTHQISATVPGIAKPAGPAPLMVYGAGPFPSVSIWVEGDPHVAANGTDAAKVHLRAWDKDGHRVDNQPERFIFNNLGSTTGRFADITVTPAWDPAGQDYVISVTSTSAQIIIVGATLDDAGSDPKGTWSQPIQFVGGPVARLSSGSVGFAASNGSCDGYDEAEGTVYASPVDDRGVPVGSIDGGVVFSLPPGSPLTLTSDPVQTRPDMSGGVNNGYSVSVKSAVTGTFDVNVRSADGSLTDKVSIVVSDGLIDAAASTVTLEGGPALANGTDSYTLKANLVSMCHVPVAGLATAETDLKGNSYFAKIDAVAAGTGVQIGALTADPAHPGVYTAKVTARQAGSYALTLDAVEWDPDLIRGGGKWVTVPVNPTPLVAAFTAASTNVKLSLLGDGFMVATDRCTGVTTVSPDKLTATVAVTDAAGKPVVGAAVKWSGDAALLLDSETGVTRDDGTATVTVRLDVAKWAHTGTPVLRAEVNGAQAVIDVPVNVLINIRPPVVTWTVTAAPTGADPVPADGKASWTVSAHAVNECGAAAPDQQIWFAVNGSAALSDDSLSTDADGWARVRVTDAVAETVAVSVRMWSSTGPEVAGSPVSVEFVSLPVVIVGVPVLGVANRTVISGTVVVGTGQSEPVSVQVTYPSTRGPLTIDTAVRDKKWSVATPADAVSGTLTLVARDARDNASVRVTGELVIPALRAEVGAVGVHRTQTQTVTGFNFAPGERVHLVVQSKELDLGVATADDNGKVVFTLKIPADFEVGDHTAKLTGEKSGSVSVGFKVLADEAKPKAPTGGIVVPDPVNTALGAVLPAGELLLLVTALIGAAATGQRGRVARRRRVP